MRRPVPRLLGPYLAWTSDTAFTQRVTVQLEVRRHRGGADDNGVGILGVARREMTDCDFVLARPDWRGGDRGQHDEHDGAQNPLHGIYPPLLPRLIEARATVKMRRPRRKVTRAAAMDIRDDGKSAAARLQ